MSTKSSSKAGGDKRKRSEEEPTDGGVEEARGRPASRISTTSTDNDNDDETKTIMTDAQKQLEEKRAYNRQVSARARARVKDKISSLTATVEAQSKRLLELEQARGVLLEQARVLEADKRQLEQVLRAALQGENQGNPSGGRPQDFSTASTLPNDEQTLMMLAGVLGERSQGAAAAAIRPTPPAQLMGSPLLAEYLSSMGSVTLGNANNVAQSLGQSTISDGSSSSSLHEGQQQELALLQLLQRNQMRNLQGGGGGH